MITASPLRATLVTFSALALVMSVHAVRGLVRARDARRWLGQHG